MKKMSVAVSVLIAIVFLICGCTAKSGENIVFGTFYNIKIKGADSYKSINTIEQLFEEIENQVSTSVEDSDVYKINNASIGLPIPINRHTKELFLVSKQMYTDTQAAFNAAIYPLVELWKFGPDNFTHNNNAIPSLAQVNELLPFCNFDYFEYDAQNQTITKLHQHAKLDFGGIAKGYAVDLAKEVASSARDVLIDVGGNIITFGKTKKIGLAHPRASSSLFGIIHLKNMAIATSGDYERYYVVDDTRYCHIIAQDGFPVGISDNNEIISVSVIGQSALMCDVFSTAVMILGEEWAEEHLINLGYSCIIITEHSYKIIGDVHFE